MGIRYYAYPVEQEIIEMVRGEPRLFLSDDPLMDAWGPAEERPEMLYLDKCWDELQSLFHPEPGTPVRPAHRLVAGQVTMIGWEWEAHIAVLDAGEVAAVAADLATVTDDDVATWLRAGDAMHRRDGFEGAFGYVTHFLHEAQEFTNRLAQRGSGLVYLIG
jgi:hypothetical protein